MPANVPTIGTMLPTAATSATTVAAGRSRIIATAHTSPPTTTALPSNPSW